MMSENLVFDNSVLILISIPLSTSMFRSQSKVLHPHSGLFATLQSMDILVCQSLHRRCVVPEPGRQD